MAVPGRPLQVSVLKRALRMGALTAKMATSYAQKKQDGQILAAERSVKKARDSLLHA